MADERDERDEIVDLGGVGSAGWPLSGRQTVALVIAAVALVFVVQNTERVSIDVLTVTLTAPLWVVLAVQFVIGALVGVLLQRRRERS